MADYNLGTARGRIEIDATGAEKGAKKAGKAVDGLSGKWAKAGPGMVAAGGAVGSIGAVVAGGFALAVNSAMDFEKRMSAVQAVSGATQSEMKTLSDKALQLGADTSFSASEAATAIEELVKAGVSVPEVMNGAADSVVALAAAGEIALPEAATIAANAMNAFNINAKDMPHIADLIAGAANASAIDVGEFGQSMSQVSAVAALAGLSFDDTAVAIAEMGNAGIKGSDAGTSLKSFLSNLQPTTDKAASAMQELGLMTKDGANAFYDAQGKLKPLSEIQGILNKSTKDLSAEQKQMALETIFGSDAIRAAAILAKEGVSGYEELGTAMGKTSAADVAAERMDNLAGKWEGLKGSAETLAITIGEKLMDPLSKVVEKVTDLVNWFTNLDDGTQTTILMIIGAIGAFSAILGIVLAVAGAIGMLMTALAPLAALIGITAGVLLGWIVVIVAIVAAVIALGIIIWRNWDKIVAWTKAAWDTVKQWIGDAWDWVVDKISAGWDAIKGFFTGIGQSIAGVWEGIWNSVKDVFATIWDWIVAAITWYVNIPINIIKAVFGVLLGWWEAFWGTFGGLLTAIWDFLGAIVRLGVALIMYVIRTALIAIQAVWSAAWGFIVGIVTFYWNLIKTAVTIGINFIRGIIQTVMTFILGIMRNVWNAIVAVTMAVWAKIKQYIITPITAAAAKVAAVAAGIRDKIAAAFNAAKAKATAIFERMKSAVVEKINALKTKISGVVDTVKGIFSGAGSWLYNAGKSIVQGLIDGVTNMISSLTSKLDFITNLIPDHKGPPAKDKKLLYQSGQWIMGGLEEGLGDGWGNVAAGLQQMTTDFPDLVATQQITAAPAEVAASALASPASAAAAAQSPESGALKVVSGTFTIDKNGVAWFQGLAQEVVDNERAFAGTTGRMGGY